MARVHSFKNRSSVHICISLFSFDLCHGFLQRCRLFLPINYNKLLAFIIMHNDVRFVRLSVECLDGLVYSIILNHFHFQHCSLEGILYAKVLLCHYHQRVQTSEVSHDIQILACSQALMCKVMGLERIIST